MALGVYRMPSHLEASLSESAAQQPQKRSIPVDHNELMLFLESFFQPKYSIEDAIRVFGQIQDDSLPNWIILKPKSEELELVKLEYVDLEVESIRKRFLVSIFVRYLDTIPVSFNKFRQKYGAPEELTRVKPHSDIPYRFDIAGKKMVGDVILFVRERTEKDLQAVHSFKLTRYPREN